MYASATEANSKRLACIVSVWNGNGTFFAFPQFPGRLFFFFWKPTSRTGGMVYDGRGCFFSRCKEPSNEMLFSSIKERFGKTWPTCGTESEDISTTNGNSDISPMSLSFSQLLRNILASNPRVTRFHINWEGSSDKMEDCENVDPSPNIGGMLPPTCVPGKMPPLGLMPDNSMDCM